MALATRCPHCQTAFRVASDQLKLRAGLVRCGTCKEIFNGIENLLHPDEDIVAATAAPTPPIPTIEEAVVTTRHVRGDETRFNDLIAEVDHPPASARDASHDRLWQALDAPVADTEVAKTDADHLLANAQEAAEPVAEPAAHADALQEDEDEHVGKHGHDHEHQHDHDLKHDHDGDRDIEPASPESAGTENADATLPPAPDAEDESGSESQSEPGPAAVAEDDAPALPHLLRAAAIDDAPAAPDTMPTAAPAPARPRRIATSAVPAMPAQSLGELADRLPDFVRDDEVREDRHRARRPLLIAAAVLLAVALLAQGVYTARSSLAANFPPLRPLLDAACNLAGCAVGLPMQIESVSIESSDFQPLPGRPDQFLLSVLLRNRSATVQAWPTVELTLNDATDKAVGRRLIGPRDYLPAGQTAARGFSAGSEQALRLVFDLSRLKASGYRVYVFYP